MRRDSDLQPSDCGENKWVDFHQLDAIFQAFSDLILCLDADGRILSGCTGRAAAPVLPLEQVVGRNIQEIFPEDVSLKFKAAIRETIETEKVVSVDYQLKLPTGERWFEGRLVSSTKFQVIAVVRDVTEYARAIEQVRSYLHRLAALHTIDAAIASSFDLNVTLSVILRQVIVQLGVDAADILLYDPHTQMLKFTVGEGFRTRELRPAPAMVGQGYAGIAVLERHSVTIPHLDDRQIDFLFSPELVQEEFMSYFAVPLIEKGQVEGVLEIYHRSVFQPDDDWLDFLATLAGQTALAINSASMSDDLKRTKTELSLAYETFVESWTRMLELSSRENGEHSRRVVDLSIQLARSMHVGEDGLTHIWRGALLHDIGKLGIPENILNKPGPLDDGEWKIIRSHPTLAYQFLSPINYLAPVLDIPHYHHERWDGSGYPAGLRGEQIPFVARLFAVVDVYDALISSRAYRPSWSSQEALKYIQDQSGVLFDPAVVDAFLKLMRTGTSS